MISFDELQVMSMGPTELADALMDPMMMAMGGMLGNQPITAAPAIQFSQSRQLPPFSSANHRSSRHLVQPITADPAIQFGQSQQLPPFSSANHSSSRHSFQPIKALPYISIPLIRAPHTMQRNGKNYFLGWQKN